MYSEEDVRGVNTDIMIVLFESKDAVRAQVTVSNNLGTAYIAKDVADVLQRHVKIGGFEDLDDLFSAFTGNCKLLSLNTALAQIRSEPKKRENEPYATTICIGGPLENEPERGTCPITMFNVDNKAGTFLASLPTRRANATKQLRKDLALTASLFTELVAPHMCADEVAELLAAWPTTDEQIQLGKYRIKRELYEIRTHYTISATVVVSPAES